MKKLRAIRFTLVSTLLISLSIQSCYTDNEEELYGKTIIDPTTCNTATATFATVVSPLLTAKCATSGCHDSRSASAGANFSSYATIKSYLTNGKAAFLGSIKHSSSFSNMPQGGSKLPDCDIAKLEAWINAGMLNN